MAETKTHWKKLQHPDYIGAYELLDGTATGKELIVQIESVKREMITGADGKKEECTVCYLKGQKPMILNATNQKAMTKAFGTPYIEDWSGRRMTLYVAKVRAFGETVDALRVRTEEAKIKLPDLTPKHEKWESAKTAIKSGNTSIEAIRKAYILSDENEKLLMI